MNKESDFFENEIKKIDSQIVLLKKRLHSLNLKNPSKKLKEKYYKDLQKLEDKKNILIISKTKINPQDEEEKCKICGKMLKIDNNKSLQVCVCGFTNKNLDTTFDYTSFDTDINNCSKYTYKRLSQFIKAIKKCQIEKKYEIIIDKTDKINVKNYIKQNIKCKMQHWSTNHIKNALKKLGLLKKYPDDVNHKQMLFEIKGVKRLRFSAEEFKNILTFMLQIMDKFEEIRFKFFPERKNFPQHSYLICQICLVFDYIDHLPRFKIIKSINNLIYYDKIWYRILESLDKKHLFEPMVIIK